MCYAVIQLSPLDCVLQFKWRLYGAGPVQQGKTGHELARFDFAYAGLTVVSTWPSHFHFQVLIFDTLCWAITGSQNYT